MKFLNSKSFQKQSLDFHHLAITSPLSKVFTFPLSSLTLFRFLFSTEAWWDKRRTFSNRHRLEDQDRRENGDHDEDDKLDDEMKQSDANFSDQSNNFFRLEVSKCRMPKPTQARFFHCANFAETFVNCQLCKNISKTKWLTRQSQLAKYQS